MDPNNLEAYFARAEVFTKGELFIDAINDYTIISQKSSSTTKGKALFLRGELYLTLKKPLLAFEDFQESCRLSPQNSHCFTKKIYALKNFSGNEKITQILEEDELFLTSYLTSCDTIETGIFRFSPIFYSRVYLLCSWNCKTIKISI